VFKVANSTWICLSPGHLKPHVWMSWLTYLGCIPPVSLRSEWNLCTIYLQARWIYVWEDNLCVYSNEFDCRLPFTRSFQAHVWMSHLTYSGRIPLISLRSEWNLGTTYLRVSWIDVLTGNLCVDSNEFDLNLPFTRQFQAPCVGESLDIFTTYLRVSSINVSKAIYMFTGRKSAWNCPSPGRLKPHEWVSYLT